MRTALAISILALLGGCTVDVGASGASAVEGGTAALTGTVGVLEVERQADADGALITAAFARYQGLREGDVLPLIGTGVRADLDSCVLVDGASDPIGLDSSGDVELIDAGTVEVRLADVTTRLVPRTFPDVASVMAGVFYADEAALPLPVAGDSYVLRSMGSGQVGAFELTVGAPNDVAVVVFGEDDGTVARDHSLEFSWLPGDVHGAGDVVEIELASRGGTLACRASDDGTFRIEPSVLAGLGADNDAELVVRRVRTRSFSAEGLDAAYARLAITRTERVVVR